jgi:hypothetical protein
MHCKKEGSKGIDIQNATCIQSTWVFKNEQGWGLLQI